LASNDGACQKSSNLRRQSLKKAKRNFWNTQFELPTLSKIIQKQNKIDISIKLQHKHEAE
jgi:hypothetical protein